MRASKLIVGGATLLAVGLGVVLGWSPVAEARGSEPPPHCEIPNGEALDIPIPARPYTYYTGNEDDIRAKCPPGDGFMWIGCRDERDFLGDDQGVVAVAEDSPQWWLEEIAIESTVNEGRGCGLAQHPPDELCSRRTASERQNTHGLIDDECWGTYPSENYQMAWQDGGPGDFKNKMQGWLGSWMFNIGKGAILLVLWLIGWAFRFDVTEFTKAASRVAGSYQTNVIGPFNLEDFVWFILLAWAGLAALRRKLGMAAGEIAVAFVLAGLGTLLFAHRADYMDSVADLMDETSARLLVAGQPERCLPESSVPSGSEIKGQADCGPGEVLVRSDPARSAQIEDEVRPLQQHIHETFVEQPWAYLNWGRMPTDECLEAQNEIAVTGYQDDGWPERHMARTFKIVGENVRGDRATGELVCNQEADFVKDVTGTRMLGAFLNMVASLVIAFLLGLMALTLVLSKFTVALLFAAVPFAALLAILPGAGRRLSWSWLGILIQVIVTVVGSSFMLVFVLIGVDSVPEVSESFSLMEREGGLVIVAIVGFFGAKRGADAGKRAGESTADALMRATPAGTGWSGQTRGLDVAGIQRGAGRVLGSAGRTTGAVAGWGAVLGVGAVAGGAGFAFRGGMRTVIARRTEARVQRRSRASYFQGNISYRQAMGAYLEEPKLPGGPSLSPAPAHAPRKPSRTPAGPGPASPASPVEPPVGTLLPGGAWARPAEYEASKLTPSAPTGGAAGGPPDPGGGRAGRTLILHRGAPANVDTSDRKQLWRYAQVYEQYPAVWDTDRGRFFNPVQAGKERSDLQRHVENHQWGTTRHLEAQVTAGVIDPARDTVIDTYNYRWSRVRHGSGYRWERDVGFEPPSMTVGQTLAGWKDGHPPKGSVDLSVLSGLFRRKRRRS